MHQSHFLSALLVGFIIGTPACGSKFVSLGEQDAGSGGSGALSTGGSGTIFGAGGSDGCVCEDPQPLAQICVDGSVKAAFCARDPSGAGCGWFSEACPVAGAGGSGSPGQGAGGSNGCSCSGPAPDVASQWCPDGTLAGPTCEPDASGVCSWQVRGCSVDGAGGAYAGVGGAGSAGGAMPAAGGAMPAAGGAIAAVGGSSGCVCTGPIPKTINYVCSDGSIAGPVCEIDASGECSWQIRVCVDGAGGAASVGGAAALGGSTGGSITCEYNGTVYGEGQSFPATDGCNTCYCMSAGIACTKMACVVGAGGASSVSTSDPSCPFTDAVPNCTNGGELVVDPTTGCSRYVCL